MTATATAASSSSLIALARSGVTLRGLPSHRMKPSQSAPAATAARASAGRVIPHTLTMVRRAGSIARSPPGGGLEAGESGGRILAGHEDLSHQHGVAACGAQAREIFRRRDPALGHGRDERWHLGN